MHRHALLHANADRRDLVLRERPTHPDAASPFHLIAVDPERTQDLDQETLKSSHVGDDIDGLDEADDRVADELARPVPGDLATSIHVDHGCAVLRSLLRLGSFARGVHRLVFEKDQGVRARAVDHLGVDGTLQRPPVEVRHRCRSESGGEDLKHHVVTFVA